MIERTVTIVNSKGLHTRPAASLVKTAAKFQAELTIRKDNMEINGKSIIGVMTLAAEQGAQLTLRLVGTCSGADSTRSKWRRQARSRVK